jgi:hypothetical protein
MLQMAQQQNSAKKKKSVYVDPKFLLKTFFGLSGF